MKTQGQRLFERHHPQFIRVVPAHLSRPTEADAFWVLNPSNPTPWHLLTEACRESWEKSAVGHHLFSGERK